MNRIIKHPEAAIANEENLKQKLKAFSRGQLTWAEVEGMTFEEAKAIAAVGCDLAASGRLDDARVIFEGLVAGNPKDSAARAALGTVYQKLGRTADAITEYTVALETDPRNPVALANRGELRLRAGDRAGFKDLAKALEYDPYCETAAARRAKSLVKAITMAAVQVAKAR